MTGINIKFWTLIPNIKSTTTGGGWEGEAVVAREENRRP